MIENNYYKKTDISLLLACLLCFFAFIPAQLGGITLNGTNISIFRIFVLITLVFCLFSKKLYKFPIAQLNRLGIIMAFWVVISCVQLMVSQNVATSLKYILVLASAAFVIIYFDIFVEVNSKNLKLMFDFIILAAFINYIILIYEINTGKYLGVEEEYLYEIYQDVRNAFGKWIPFGFIGNPNNVGLYCFLIQFVMCARLAIEKTAWKKCAILACCIVNVYVWLSTDSRTALLCVVLMLFFFVVFIPKRKSFKTIAWLSVPIVAVAGIFLLTRLIGFSPDSDSVRVNMIRNGIDILFRKSHCFGVGLGNAENFIEAYGNTWDIRNLHNFVVEVLVSGGIFVFGMLGIWYTGTILGYIRGRYRDEDPQKRVLCAISATSMVVFILASSSPASCMQLSEVWMFFALQILIKKFIKTDVKYWERKEPSLYANILRRIAKMQKQRKTSAKI